MLDLIINPATYSEGVFLFELDKFRETRKRKALEDAKEEVWWKREREKVQKKEQRGQNFILVIPPEEKAKQIKLQTAESGTISRTDRHLL